MHKVEYLSKHNAHRWLYYSGHLSVIVLSYETHMISIKKSLTTLSKEQSRQFADVISSAVLLVDLINY